MKKVFPTRGKSQIREEKDERRTEKIKLCGRAEWEWGAVLLPQPRGEFHVEPCDFHGFPAVPQTENAQGTGKALSGSSPAFRASSLH